MENKTSNISPILTIHSPTYQQFLTDIENTTQKHKVPSLKQCELLFRRSFKKGNICFKKDNKNDCYFVDMGDTKTQQFCKDNKFDDIAIFLLTEATFSLHQIEDIKEALRYTLFGGNIKDNNFLTNLAITMRKICCIRDILGAEYLQNQQSKWKLLTQQLIDKERKENRTSIIKPLKNNQQNKQKKEKIKSLVEKTISANNKKMELMKSPQYATINKIKTIYKWKNNANNIALEDEIKKLKEEVNDKNNMIKTQILKNLLQTKQQKIDNNKQKEHLAMAKTFHNWNITALKQKNKELEVRVNNFKKGYALIEQSNKQYRDELKEKLDSVRNELKQLHNKNNEKIFELKKQYEKEKEKIIEQCNTEAKHLLEDYAKDMEKQISAFMNDELVPNYQLYKTQYIPVFNDKVRLEKINKELSKQNNELKTKLETANDQTQRYFNLYYKQKDINKQLQKQTGNLDMMNYHSNAKHSKGSWYK